MSHTATSLPDLLTDGTLFPIATIAARRLGKRPSPATCWRWTRRGVAGGIKLPSVTCGRATLTTDAAFSAWLAAQTDARHRCEIPEPDETTDDDLRAAGLL